jgi:DNA repair exonuclease SbcCD ATPase subunit
MIERYDNPDDNGWMNPDSSGEWVLYSDYAKLEARNKKLQAVYSGCDHDPEKTSKGFCWQCRIKELEKRIKEREARIEPLQPFKERIKELEAEKDEQENAHVASNMQNAELKATIERVRGDMESMKENAQLVGDAALVQMLDIFCAGIEAALDQK